MPGGLLTGKFEKMVQFSQLDDNSMLSKSQDALISMEFLAA